MVDLTSMTPPTVWAKDLVYTLAGGCPGGLNDGRLMPIAWRIPTDAQAEPSRRRPGGRPM